MIYDQPNHPAYGPVRRLHLKLMELFGSDLATIEDAYVYGIGSHWTEVVANSQQAGEAHVARSVIKLMLHLHDTIECQRAADRVAFFKGPCRGVGKMAGTLAVG